MQKKIFNTITAMVLVAVIIFVIFTSVICYWVYIGSAERELISVAEIATAYNQTPEEVSQTISNELDYNVRISFIEMDGKVSYDNLVDISIMDNHANRPEVIEAMATGTGKYTRSSQTMGKETFYYAIKFNDGVLRFSRDVDSVYSIIISSIAIIVVIAGLIIILTTVISMKLSEGLILPVKSLVSRLNILANNNSEEGDSVQIVTEYEELTPVALSIKRLSKQLKTYISQLKEDKETIDLITNNMVEGMVLLDKNNNILSINPSAVSMLSPTYIGGEGRSILEVTRCGEFLRLLDESGKSKGIGSIEGDFNLNGRRLRAFFSSIGDMVGTVIIILDITETFNAEAMRRDFSANVSHELKTPLTTISGFGEMMETGIISNVEDVKKYGGLVKRESSRLLMLINDIIRLSELEEGTATPTISEVDIYAVSCDVYALLGDKGDRLGVDLELFGDKQIIMGNGSFIHEIIYNLVDNSLKYNTKGGYVHTSVGKSDEKTAYITVSDSGIGIPAEHQEHIFERFYRVDKSRSKLTGGTGLGLSIVKHLVNSMDGTIHLRSEVGKGTEIRVELPINM